MNTLIDPKGWVKLFKMYYNIDISAQFLSCADIQLTDKFKKATEIVLDRNGQMTWEQKITPEVIIDKTSTITANILFKFGLVPVKLAWNSASGNIYGINDSYIDCDDINFWFEDLDVEKCLRFHKPNFSKFFTFYETAASYLKNSHLVDLSTSYIMCMREHLSADFEFKTGFKINKNIELAYDSDTFFYEKGKISRTQATIYVNHNWNNKAQICWKSKSGRIYEMTDEDIDCNDIEMWFENLEPELYYKQMYPKDALPFKLKNLTYQLTINSLQTDCEIHLVNKKEQEDKTEDILKSIYNFINEYNELSEKKNREMGIVHNASGTVTGNKITLNIDLGSTGADFLKKLLDYFSSLITLETVTVD
ncbi:hypothetical protein D3C87_185140 [compost metagenome]